MRLATPLALILVFMIGACSDRSGFDKETEACIAAERKGLLATAANACNRALNIADSNNFSPLITSQTLYRLGRLKRQQGKFVEAEELLNRSLVIEQQLGNTRTLEIGNRLIELSLSLAGQKRWSDGAQILERLIPMAGVFSENARTNITNILKQYSLQLNKTGQKELAKRLETNAAKLKQWP